MVPCACLLVGIDWACPLKGVLCACPLSVLILSSGVLNRTLSHICWIYSRGSVTYGVAKVLPKILKPSVGKSPHHVHTTKDFVERVSKVTFQPGKYLCSYNVTVLFTSVPVDPALNIIQDLLEQDTSLCDRTVLSVQNIKRVIRVLPS